jgi:hypothetical protein
MSIKSEIWVSAHLRRARAAGLMAVLVRKGAPEAGAIFVRAILPGGLARLFGPAPGSNYKETGEKHWALPLGFEPIPEAKTDEYIARQAKFDPDIWLIDVEDREGMALIPVEALDKP